MRPSRALLTSLFNQSLMLLAVYVLLSGKAAAQVTGHGIFQLDGNVATEAVPPATDVDDWANVLFGGGASVGSCLLTDTFNSRDDNIFFPSIGSKDTKGIQQGPWLSQHSKSEGKDDLLHAFAAAYIDPANGHFLIY